MAEEMEDLTLFVRGMNRPSKEIEDVWDDTIINNAYDRALMMANEQVAKRIAMETNSKKKEDSKPNAAKAKGKPKKSTVSPSKPTSSKKATEWKLGMPCRAIYEEDGAEYEAYLVEMIGDEDCIIKFLGYDNSEKVKISSLKPTLGDEERMRQLQDALGERADDGFESQPASDEVEVSDSIASSDPAERRSNRKNKGGKKKKTRIPDFDFGDLPAPPMPSLNMFRNMGFPDMPMPPPPLASLDRTDAEEQAISDMLLSWYMTGYYTGLYHGMKRQRQSRQYN